MSQDISQERDEAITVWLGELPIDIRSSLIRQALFTQMPAWVTGGPADPQAKILRTTLKTGIQLGLKYVEWQLVKNGSRYPGPDHAAMKHDVLTYGIGYFLDLVLYGLCGQEWRALYEEASDGTLEITGLAPAAQYREASDLSGGTAAGDTGEPEGTEQPEPDGIAGGTVVPGGDIGERENDLCQATGERSADPVA